ncbi:hypothetical protein ARALYDRAFT_471403 [Arabidopsis lyrata subsp. lyrata]|uniref:BHLH domain-containing protein n=1 Tax=Arabidopsis lyrata subsp. lyrata TaxID=81972 RepID=D7KND7_ARALL|nr:hypothetical protein ARALYDRAFT_471403 [Arabidopsis lyrata subsp. lyrata]
MVTSEIREGDDEPKNKRAKHKELERQRRQEITSLFKNLRYLLPSQYTKGKRSSADHVLEAVNYIKDLQKKIKEVSKKRDRIKRSITHPSSTGECSIISLTSSTCSCTCWRHTHCCYRSKLLLQTRILSLKCSSTSGRRAINALMLIVHTIVSEVEEGIEVYYSELQENIIKMGTTYVVML